MTGVILDPDCSILDPDTSQFTTMLMKLSGADRKTIPAGRLAKGDWVNADGSQWVVLSIEHKNPDDWFSDEKIASLGKPWKKSLHQQRMESLEQMLFFGMRP